MADFMGQVALLGSCQTVLSESLLCRLPDSTVLLTQRCWGSANAACRSLTQSLQPKHSLHLQIANASVSGKPKTGRALALKLFCLFCQALELYQGDSDKALDWLMVNDPAEREKLAAAARLARNASTTSRTAAGSRRIPPAAAAAAISMLPAAVAAGGYGGGNGRGGGGGSLDELLAISSIPAGGAVAAGGGSSSSDGDGGVLPWRSAVYEGQQYVDDVVPEHHPELWQDFNSMPASKRHKASEHTAAAAAAAGAGGAAGRAEGSGGVTREGRSAGVGLVRVATQGSQSLPPVTGCGEGAAAAGIELIGVAAASRLAQSSLAAAAAAVGSVSQAPAAAATAVQLRYGGLAGPNQMGCPQQQGAAAMLSEEPAVLREARLLAAHAGAVGIPGHLPLGQQQQHQQQQQLVAAGTAAAAGTAPLQSQLLPPSAQVLPAAAGLYGMQGVGSQPASGGGVAGGLVAAAGSQGRQRGGGGGGGAGGEAAGGSGSGSRGGGGGGAARAGSSSGAGAGPGSSSGGGGDSSGRARLDQ